METVNERFKLIMNHYNIKGPRMAEILGVTTGLVEAMKSGSRGVSAKTILKICNEFNSINPKWLEFGEGEMFIKNYEQNTEHKAILIVII